MSSIIETYESNSYSIEELEAELEKYQELFDEGESEAYEVVLYLETRLLNILEMSKENDTRIAELMNEIKALKKDNEHLSENRLTKKDIMRIYNNESDWALKLLRMMYQCKLATKIGKSYYTTKENLDAYEKTIQGKQLFF